MCALPYYFAESVRFAVLVKSPRSPVALGESAIRGRNYILILSETTEGDALTLRKRTVIVGEVIEEIIEGTPEEIAEYDRIVNEKGTKYIPFDYVKEPCYTDEFSKTIVTQKWKPEITCSCG